MKKIKGSRSKPAPSVLIVVAALSLCALLPLRVYHVSSLIEPETGFFAKTNASVWLFYIICVLVIGFLMAASFLDDKVNRVRDCMTRNKPLGVVSLLTGVAVMFDAIVELLQFLDLTGAYNPYAGATMFSYLTKNGGTALLFGAVFAALSAAFYWIYALSGFNKKIHMRSFRILSVMPVAWSICRIISRFVTKISFVNVSDLLLELFMLVFLISFTLAFAQVVTNVTPEVSAWRLFGCGLPAALLAFVISVPRLMMLALLHTDRIVAGHSLAPCDLMLAIFIPVFLYFTTTAVKKRPLQEQPVQQEAQPEQSADTQGDADKE